MTVLGHGWDDTVGYPAYRNVIINGSMSVAQRATSVAAVTTGSYNTADRWKITANYGTYTQSIENDAPTGSGFRKSLKMACTASASPTTNQALTVYQIIEGQNVQHFAKGTSSAKSFAVSFWVKSNLTGTFVVALYDGNNTRSVGKTYTVNSSGTWEKKTVIFPADTTGAFNNDNGGSLYLEFCLGAGSGWTSGALNTTWAAYVQANYFKGQSVDVGSSNSNYWQITGIQLEVGDVTTPFEFEPYETTLRRCQRYYLVDNTNGNRFVFWVGPDGYANSTKYTYPVSLRTGVSPTIRNGVGGTAGTAYTVYGGGYGSYSWSIYSGDIHGFSLTKSGMSANTGGYAQCVFDVSAEL